MIILVFQPFCDIPNRKSIAQYVMRSLNTEGLLDFGIGCKEHVEQDEEGDGKLQQIVCNGRENCLEVAGATME